MRKRAALNSLVVALLSICACEKETRSLTSASTAKPIDTAGNCDSIKWPRANNDLPAPRSYGDFQRDYEEYRVFPNGFTIPRSDLPLPSSRGSYLGEKVEFSVGDFLSRVSTHFGGPDYVMFEGFMYGFHHVPSDTYFLAYSAGSGPHYQSLNKDRDVAIPVLQEFERLLQSTSPTDVKVWYLTDMALMVSGATDGWTFDREATFEETFEAHFAQGPLQQGKSIEMLVEDCLKTAKEPSTQARQTCTTEVRTSALSPLQYWNSISTNQRKNYPDLDRIARCYLHQQREVADKSSEKMKRTHHEALDELERNTWGTP